MKRGEFIKTKRFLSTILAFANNNYIYISLIKNVSLTETVTISSGGTFVIDFAGFSVESTADTSFMLVNTNLEIKDSVGEYFLIFADYEGAKLNGVDVVPVIVTDETVGEITRLSEKGIIPGVGDKIMLWKDTTTFSPVCEAYIVK